MFNELAKQINESVRQKGFWDSKDALLDFLNDGSDDNALIKIANDAIIAQKIALVGTELSEAVEAMRKPDYDLNGYGIGVKDSFADEIADTFIRLLDICGELGIDIDAQIEWKMGYNQQRAAKHGKQF